MEQEIDQVETKLAELEEKLNDGEILGFDARGYITNHTERSFDKSEITVEEAQKNLSPSATFR